MTAAAATRLGAAFATVLAAALLALVIAHWTWRLVAPAPVQVPPARVDDPVAAIAAADLFGKAGPTAAVDAPTADATGDVRLLGVIARRDGSGQALFRLPSGARLVASGEEVQPGLRLAAVRIDGVSVRDAAGERVLALRPPGAARPSGGSAPSSASPAGPTPAARVAVAPDPARPNVAAAAPKCQPPAGFRGDVVRLNVELVGGLISQPETWRSMVEPTGGGLVVRETAGFGQMVGLQQGDRLEQANGIALTVPDDIVAAVLRPLAANQPVRVSGRRNGQPREVWIANVGCAG